MEEAEAAEVAPRRFALRLKPPTIVVEYSRGGSAKLHHLRIHLKPILASTVRSGGARLVVAHLRAEQDCETVARKLQVKYSAYIGPEKVKREQVRPA